MFVIDGDCYHLIPITTLFEKNVNALAALAVAGTAFAQSSVSLTGKLRFAYGAAKTSANAKTTGIGVTDGDWNIAAVEDLGGGMKAGANMALRLRGRDAATDAASTGSGARPRDSSMFLSGNFGTVTVGAIEAGNGILGLVTAGGPTYIGLDNFSSTAAGVLSGASNTDILQYSTPAMSGFTAKIAALDTVGAGGAQATSTAQNATLVGFNYANGPLQAALDVTSYSANAATAPLADNRTRVSANYDLGMAKVGAGYQTAKAVGGIKRNESAVGVSVPFGSFNVGAVYASSKTDGVAGNNTGYDLAVQYNLSKRTYIALQSQSYKTAGVAGNNTNTRVQLAHSF